VSFQLSVLVFSFFTKNIGVGIDRLAKYIKTYIIFLMNIKALKFVGSSLDDLRNFPEEARRVAGFELRAIQNGLEPRDWRAIQSIGPGVKEIRIHVLGEWRVIYVAKLSDAVYVLHAFHKKGQKTNTSDIELARRRLKQIGGSL